MLLSLGVVVWCWGLLSRRPMLLRRQGMSKGRCCVLFSDLKVFLLRPPVPAPPPVIIPMNEQYTDSNGSGIGIDVAIDNSNSAASAPSPEADGYATPGPPTGEPPSAGTNEPKATEEWQHATGQTGPLDYGSSEEDCSKEKCEERFSQNSRTDSGVRTPQCRICFQGPEQGELLSPCRCSGSVRCTHEPCLIKWISERGSWSCELCYYKYHVVAISTNNPLQWQAISLTVIEKVQIAAAVLGSLFLMSSISWLVWSSLSPSAKWQRQDLLFQICYAMYGFMDLVCIALIVHEGPSVFRIFNRWQAVNQQWKVLNYDKIRDTEDHQRSRLMPRHLALPNPRTSAPPGAEPGDDMVSPSTSSLMAAVAASAPGYTVATAATASLTTVTTQDSMSEQGPPSLPDHHCAYNILHLLTQHLWTTQQEPRPTQVHPQPPQPSNSSRELVMRVTTV
ncbi:E3 ubiquitin-protein ligase MARCHF4 [Oncorhynchus tshawytscha]|uniref:RING-type E3 ubiquitin transferase n=1 Tax=Oncorhynchus tshawytscha TaxID=74940 RepID=A0AAZ3Q2V6_ONCTS|nr:E3 ubiquitin-protein ligase MARCHF4 [Oncorhynchus tshawytscha]